MVTLDDGNQNGGNPVEYGIGVPFDPAVALTVQNTLDDSVAYISPDARPETNSQVADYLPTEEDRVELIK